MQALVSNVTWLKTLVGACCDTTGLSWGEFIHAIDGDYGYSQVPYYSGYHDASFFIDDGGRVGLYNI